MTQFTTSAGLTNRTYTCQDLTTASPSDIETTTTAEECTANVGVVTERFHCYYSNLFRMVKSAMMRSMASAGPVVPRTTVSTLQLTNRTYSTCEDLTTTSF